ncbi:Ribosome biogenesis protein Sqt1 [Mycena venus]|uniref:Ribosome biogenesis protein Sqt1 n=1 Tax=Mycena venus TaxID=2733690 RepID=A0A8H6X8W7_9AGAR|nr:Ribosome biogenesis protein Sqt1 [Mycena venus]
MASHHEEIEEDFEEEQFITEDDVLAEVQDEGDVPMDEDDEDEAGDTLGELAGAGSSSGSGDDNSLQSFQNHGSSVFCVAGHPTEPLAASGGEDDLGYVWDITDGEVIVKLTGHTDSVTSIAWKGPDEVMFLRWHPKGTVLLAGSNDSTLWLWQLPSGNTMQVFAGHTGAVQCGEFTPDGKRIVTACADGVLIFWDPRSSTPVFKLTPDDARFDLDGITSLGVNPSSTLAVVGGAAGGVRVVSLNKGEVVSALGGHTEGESIEAIQFVDLTGNNTGAGGRGDRRD